MEEQDLPEGWASATLSDLGPIISGGTPKTSEPSNFDGNIPWVTPADLTGYENKTIAQGRRNISEKGLQSSSARIIPKRSVLFSSRAPIGYVAIAANELATNQGFKSVAVHEELDENYIYFYLKSAKQLAEHHASGTTFKEISGSRFAKLPVPIAPLNEQRRIVEKIETLFARLDQGEADLRQVQILLSRYRQSVLKAAVTGQLTADWRAENAHRFEHGRDLLTRILKTRRETWQGRGKYKEPITPDTTHLSDLPVGWAWCSTEQLSFVETGATPRKGKSEYYSDSGTPWVTSTAVNSDPIEAPQAFITDLALKETNTKVFPAGSLIVAMYGEGKTRGMVSELAIPAATNQACAALLTGHLPSEIKLYLKRFYKYNYEAIRLLSSGGVQPNLNLAIIKATHIPLPSAAEAEEIVRRVDNQLSSIGVAENDCKTELTRSTALRQSILKQAFAGRLVPQDPNDEPASELLARIRAAQPVGKGKTRRKATA